MLNYVDDKTLRQFVQQALNRGEAYHQLRRAIASVNGNQFRGGSDYQIDQWNDCARLIANCIIYYNAAILSGLVGKFEQTDNKEAIDMLANLSPVAWGHILLGGNYSFEEQAAIAKWHLNRSRFGIRIDHDLACISDRGLASQSITIWHASDQ